MKNISDHSYHGDRLRFSAGRLESVPEIEFSLTEDDIRDYNKDDYEEELNEIREEIGFSLPAEFRRNPLLGERFSLKWRTEDEIFGEMALSTPYQAVIFNDLDNDGYSFLRKKYPDGLFSKLRYIDGDCSGLLVYICLEENVEHLSMYIDRHEGTELEKLFLTWPEYLEYSVIMMGLSGWQQVFVDGGPDESLEENIKLGIDLLERLFPEYDYSKIKEHAGLL